MLYYQKCNCQPLIISNWNNGKFSSYLEVENFQACFCLCPPPFLLSPRAKKIFRARFARAKNFFLSPQSSGSRTGGYLLSCPTLCKHWRVDFLSQPPFFSNFSIPAALAAHRYSWTPMGVESFDIQTFFKFLLWSPLKWCFKNNGTHKLCQIMLYVDFNNYKYSLLASQSLSI